MGWFVAAPWIFFWMSGNLEGVKIRKVITGGSISDYATRSEKRNGSTGDGSLVSVAKPAGGKPTFLTTS